MAIGHRWPSDQCNDTLGPSRNQRRASHCTGHPILIDTAPESLSVLLLDYRQLLAHVEHLQVDLASILGMNVPVRQPQNVEGRSIQVHQHLNLLPTSTLLIVKP